jgi:hypothetical protein
MRWDVLTAARCQYVSCQVHKGHPCHQHFFQSARKFSFRARKFSLHTWRFNLHACRTQNWIKNNGQLWLAVDCWPQALCKEPGVSRIREVQLYCLGVGEPLDGRVFIRLPVDRFP